MAKSSALKKPAADLQPVGPTFTVLPPPQADNGSRDSSLASPFGNDDPLAAIGESAAKKTGGKSYPRAALTDPQRKQIDELNRQKIEAAALKGSMELLSGLLSPIVTDQYITQNIGLAEVPSGILATGFNSESLITLCGDSGGKYKEIPKTAAGELLRRRGTPQGPRPRRRPGPRDLWRYLHGHARHRPHRQAAEALPRRSVGSPACADRTASRVKQS